MNKIFLEFENENTQRTYPFASGCRTVDTEGVPIGSGLLIDAALYPINPKGVLYLSSISETGTVSISDSTGVIMTAETVSGSDTFEFYETGPMGRHVGTILAASSETPGILTAGARRRTFRPEATEFASTCVFPVENDGVLSLNIGDTGPSDGLIRIDNSDTDDIRISTDEKGSILRFDVIPKAEREIPKSIQQIYCIVDGKTPFRIQKIPFGISGSAGNTIAVYLDNIDRAVVCGNAHREDALIQVDTCDQPPVPHVPVDIPEFYQAEVVDIPSEADGTFYLSVQNFTGYNNPLSLKLVDAVEVPRTTVDVKTDASGRKSAEDNVKALLTSKGAVLQVPGLV